LVNQLDWDLIYYHKYNKFKLNPKNLDQPPARSPTDIMSKYHRFDLLLRHLATLQKFNLLKVTPELKTTNKTLYPTPIDVRKYYELSIKWAEGFEYKPRFIYDHFLRFFKRDSMNEVMHSVDSIMI